LRTRKCIAMPEKILLVQEREGNRIARVQYDGIVRPT
jgi:hydrogenase maturation factor